MPPEASPDSQSFPALPIAVEDIPLPPNSPRNDTSQVNSDNSHQISDERPSILPKFEIPPVIELLSPCGKGASEKPKKARKENDAGGADVKKEKPKKSKKKKTGGTPNLTNNASSDKLVTPKEKAINKLKQITLDEIFTPKKKEEKYASEEAVKNSTRKKKKRKNQEGKENGSTFVDHDANRNESNNIGEPAKKKSKTKKSKTDTTMDVGSIGEADGKTVSCEQQGDNHNKTDRPKKEQPLRVRGKLDDLRVFLEHAKTLNQRKPLNAFKELNGAKLCGYFEFINVDDTFSTNATVNEVESRLHCRYPTDLPEMTTCCIHNGGRYAIWRDDPEQSEILIVHVTAEDHFPTITVVGDRMEHVLYHLAHKDFELVKNLLPPGFSMCRLIREMKEISRERNEKKLGNGPTSVGNWINLKDGEYYQEIVAGAELKKIIVHLGEKHPVGRERAEEQMNELYECVEMAKREGVLGMDLELGQYLWLANYHDFNEKAKEYLHGAYSSLGRHSYMEILNDHFDHKEEEWTKKNEKKQRKPRVDYVDEDYDLEDYEPRYFTRQQIKNL